jgi:hypothetical protein
MGAQPTPQRRQIADWERLRAVLTAQARRTQIIQFFASSPRESTLARRRRRAGGGA